MPISVTCPCGQKLNVRDELAGKAVRCPKCGQALKIGGGISSAPPTPPAGTPARAPRKTSAAPDVEDLLDQIGLTAKGEGEECPSCGQLAALGAVLCVNCGYNFQLKRQMKTFGASTPTRTSGKPLNETEKMLVRAEDELEKEPIKQEMGYGSRSSAWLLALVMFAVAGGVIAAGIAFFNYVEGKAAKDDAARKEARQ